MLQDNVALIVVLDATAGQGQDKSAEQPKRQLICVANTHIHANPELNDVKLWQVITLKKDTGSYLMRDCPAVHASLGASIHHRLQPRYG